MEEKVFLIKYRISKIELGERIAIALFSDFQDMKICFWALEAKYNSITSTLQMERNVNRKLSDEIFLYEDNWEKIDTSG